MGKYVRCIIEWQDDFVQEDVIIKATNDILEEEDDRIFYYGLSYDEILKCIEEERVIDNEYKILEVVEVLSNCEDLGINPQEDNIELNEIVYNELPIKNLKQLSYSLFQDENLIENEDKANECLEYLNENLQKIYDFLDQFEGNELQDNDIDLYQLGDVMNFIETIKIKEV